MDGLCEALKIRAKEFEEPDSVCNDLDCVPPAFCMFDGVDVDWEEGISGKRRRLQPSDIVEVRSGVCESGDTWLLGEDIYTPGTPGDGLEEESAKGHSKGVYPLIYIPGEFAEEEEDPAPKVKIAYIEKGSAQSELNGQEIIREDYDNNEARNSNKIYKFEIAWNRNQMIVSIIGMIIGMVIIVLMIIGCRGYCSKNEYSRVDVLEFDAERQSLK